MCDIRPVRIHGQQPLPVERLGFANDVVISKTTLRRRTHACAARFPDITAGLRGAPAVAWLTSPVTAALATRKMTTTRRMWTPAVWIKCAAVGVPWVSGPANGSSDTY